MSKEESSLTRSNWIAKAQSALDRNRIVSLLRAIVDTPSPTGEEGELARNISRHLAEAGLNGQEQVIDEHQSNAVGMLTGSGDGQSLLLYSPIDTVTSNSAVEDVPWVGPELRADMRADSWVDDGHVYGLGAQNPKGHAACVFAAGEAIRAAGVPLKGNLYLGFGAGGMPSNARPGMRENSGHGAGCAHMIEQLPNIDSAVIAKSGWSVSWEEVGLAWITVRVNGTHSYVGSRHLLPFTNAINDAGRLIARLEVWFSEWAERHRTGLVAPQGVVSHIESGWERMPAFTPAECRFQIDLRVSPRTSREEVDEQFGAAFDEFCSELEIDATWERTVFISGTTTEPDSAIIKKCIQAWESIENQPHQAVAGLSGATDANILRSAQIPTARIGLTKAAIPDIDFELGMNTANIDGLHRLTKLLVHVAVDYCLDDASGPTDG